MWPACRPMLQWLCVADKGSQALLQIAWSSPGHRAAAVAAGAVPVLVAAWGRHSGEARQSAHLALERLGYT